MSKDLIMYIGSVLNSWIVKQMPIKLLWGHRSTAHIFKRKYRYEIRGKQGDFSPYVFAVYNNPRNLTQIVTISVGEEWIKMNVPKEILAASIAERMLHVEKSYDSQFSLA